MKQFEDLTIKQLKRITEEYRQINPTLKTAEELLEELNNKGEKNANTSTSETSNRRKVS